LPKEKKIFGLFGSFCAAWKISRKALSYFFKILLSTDRAIYASFKPGARLSAWEKSFSACS
jgi:hypothetical protein